MTPSPARPDDGVTPRVSVVIPAYQAQRHLGAAVSSALTQTYPDVEVVITDDGSSDATGAIAASYGDLVRVVTQPNGGLSAARNAAIAQASGELIALLDADDILLPPYVEAAVDAWRAAQRSPRGAGPTGDEAAAGDADAAEDADAATDAGRTWVSCDAYILSDSGLHPNRRVLLADRPTGDAQRQAILERNFVTVFSVFPRAMWREVGGFDTSMGVCEDYDFWARAIFAGWRVTYQREAQALYRRSAGSLSTQRERMYRGEEQVLAHVDERFGAQLSDAERAFLDLRRAHGSTESVIDAGDAALRAGDLRGAAAHLRTAARLAPGNRRLRLKAAALGLAPALGGLYRRRMRDRDAQMGATDAQR